MRYAMLLLCLCWAGNAMGDDVVTHFQTAAPWNPRVDLQADAAVVYGVNPTFEARVKGWREQGYRVQMMTGSAWGEYDDYFAGRFDGKTHHDEAQVMRNGQKMMHGPLVPYIVPTASYRKYLTSLTTRAIDAGVEAIYLEEPEYWAFTGYSEGFKREWKNYYHQDWQPPHSSVDARYKTAKLMYMLYRDTLSEVFANSKAYAKDKSQTVGCFVPTHSLVNYSMWRIVTPMASLAGVKSIDGYIAQVWTGTARTPNNYRGVLRSRTFETAFLEYAQMISVVRPTGRVCYLLADPVEDNPDLGWDDYEDNYRRVLVASLMQPDEWHYEIAPWPDRIFDGTYFATNADAARRKEANPPQRIKISERYAAVLQNCFNALNAMHAAPAECAWDCGTTSIGVAISDTMMFQRDVPTPSDPELGCFFGLALPLLKHGMPVKVVQLETLTDVKALAGIRVLLLTYEGMKPMSAGYHKVLAQWVKAGGALLLVDDGQDPYHAVLEWWNTPPLHYAKAYQHLLEQLDLPADAAAGVYDCGKGFVDFMASSPTKLSKATDGDATLRAHARALLEKQGGGTAWREQGHLILRRGDKVVAARLDESLNNDPVEIPGTLVDLFDAGLAIRQNPKLPVNQVGLFVDLAKVASPGVAASSSRIREVKAGPGQLSFVSRGPLGIPCTTVVRLPAEPKTVRLLKPGKAAAQPEVEHHDVWSTATSTLAIHHANLAEPVRVNISW